ncbi:MAG TPA: MerR family transcriptional regulator [Gaiellaceae bacterium]|jgi:DNA-binding transcriptional MerR regulator|nr:MerR family transcriptional regulator [Gaiellaceae bacterium]
MSVPVGQRGYRIGEVAERLGVSTRTIRYYEELGLLGGAVERSKGAQRLYVEADVARLQRLIELRQLLGLTLEDLCALAEADEARSDLREQWDDDPTDAERQRIVSEAIPLVERQLELVRARQRRIAEFADELEEKLRSLHDRRAELGDS